MCLSIDARQLAYCCLLLLVVVSIDVRAQDRTPGEVLADAQALYDQGDYGHALAQALQLVEESVYAGADRQPAYRLLGLCYVALGDLVEAREAVRRLLLLDPDYDAEVAKDPPAYVRLVQDVRLRMKDTYAVVLDPDEVRGGEEKDYVEVEIFYGTDRLDTRADEPAERYSGERGTFKVGTCMVSIPRGHQVGVLESPAWYRFEFRENPSRHIVLHEVNEMAPEDMLGRMRAVLNQTDGRGLLVFIHGYNVTFADAARRTAQLAFDLGFDGAPVLYSWPANGGLLDYTSDENDVQWTVPHLRAFLEDLVSQTGARQVHVIAHSMGNRALTAALQQIAAEHPEPLLNQVILTAPDIDADIFRRDIVPRIQSLAERVTLYASSADKALELSYRIHEYPRAGQSGDELVVMDGVDTVDASAVATDLLGHSYFAETRVLLQDLFLLLQGVPPNERNLLVQERGKERFWVFRP